MGAVCGGPHQRAVTSLPGITRNPSGLARNTLNYPELPGIYPDWPELPGTIRNSCRKYTELI